MSRLHVITRCRRPPWRPGRGLLSSLALVPLLAVGFGSSALPAGAASPAAVHAAVAPKAYVGLFQDNAVAVLDTAANRVLSTIPVPAGPHGIVASLDGDEVFVSSDGASTVSVIDTATNQVEASVEVGQAPHGLAITPDGSEVLAAVFGANQVVAIDAETYQVVGQVPVPQPHNIAITPDGKTAYVASQQAGATSLAILDVPSLTQTGSVPLDKTPRALNFDPAGTRLYFTLAGADAVQVLDPATNQIVAQIPVGASPHHPLITGAGDFGLVVSQGPGELALFDPASNTVLTKVQVGKMPHWIALGGGGQTAYVTNEASNDVSVVDLKSGRVTATIPVGNAPRKIVIAPVPDATAAGVTAPLTPAAQAVTIGSFAFSPARVTVAPGQTVTWTNADPVRHNVTSDGGAWTPTNLDSGQSFSATLTQPGTYTYHCAIHPFMTGEIDVQA